MMARVLREMIRCVYLNKIGVYLRIGRMEANKLTRSRIVPAILVIKTSLFGANV